jgi:hypothetical protein
VIVLDQDPDNSNLYNVLLWVDVPTARQRYYANPNAASAWKDALATDVQLLQTGAVLEQTSAENFPSGTTMNQVMQYLQARWQNFQNQINAVNPWLHYGSNWDGTNWTVTTGG